MAVWQDRIVQNPRTFSIQNNADGTITLIPAPGTVVQTGTPINAVSLNALELLKDNMKGTTSTPTFDSSGNVTKIQHKDSGSNVIRTDTFDYSQANMIIETRTLSSGDTITLKYHTDTLQTEVI